MTNEDRHSGRWRDAEDLLGLARDQSRSEKDFFALLDEEMDQAAVRELAVAGDGGALERWPPKGPDAGPLLRWNAIRTVVNAGCAREQSQRSRQRAARAGSRRCTRLAAAPGARGGRNSA
jgi:hypothetical protein